MGTELALRTEPSAVMLSETQLNFIARTEFVPKAFRGNLPAILACVATGRSLGLPDMTALRSINIIEGKATFSAELMVQLVRSHGHSITGDVSGEQAVVRGKRADNGDEMTATWTVEMAQRAGLMGKQNWQRYPEAMLWARAVSQLCRMLFADCFAGATYTPEEGEYTADELFDDEPLQASAEEPQAMNERGDFVDADAASADEAPASQPSSADIPPQELATEAQRNLILVRASKAGLDDDARHALLERVTGQPSTTRVRKSEVNAVLDAIEAAAV